MNANINLDIEYLKMLVELGHILNSGGSWVYHRNYRLRVDRYITDLCDNGYDVIVRQMLQGAGLTPANWMLNPDKKAQPEIAEDLPE